jgi:hypothetical protein
MEAMDLIQQYTICQDEKIVYAHSFLTRVYNPTLPVDKT